MEVAMKKKTLIETERLYIVDAVAEDIDFIMEMENDAENRKFVWQGTREQHENEIVDEDTLLVVFWNKSDDGSKGAERIGYSLNAINRKSDIFELRRIVINNKGEGYGRETIKALMKHAFGCLGTNRFWLDVYPDNVKGISLYESLGMHKDGILRQNYKSDRGYLDQIVYSILKDEYKG